MLNDKLGKLAIRMRTVAVALGLAAIALSNTGCEPRRTTVAKVKPQKHSAEVDFEWAMERLRRAVENFTPSGDLNLRVKRKFSYKLLPPSESQPLYTATVTVASVSKYKPLRQQPVVDELPKRDQLADLRDQESEFGEDSFLGGEDESATTPYVNDRDIQGRNPIRVETLIKAPSVKNQSVYELIYKKRRWHLVTQPESQHEQMWFEYALQN